MFQRIFGTKKKNSTAKSLLRDPAREDSIQREDYAPPGSIPVVTTRTTSPTLGKRNHSSSLNDSKLVSSPSRSTNASPSSSVSPAAGAGVLMNASLTIRSDPVPAGFRNSSNSTAGSPSAPGSIAGSPRALVSPAIQPTEKKRPLSGNAHRLNDTVRDGDYNNNNKNNNNNISSRPVALTKRASSPELQHSRTAPTFRGSPLLFSAKRNALFSNNNSLAVGAGGMDSVAGGSGSVNYWRLPWTPQRVVMCPYCNRPVKPKHPVQMNSKEYRSVGIGSGDSGSGDVDDAEARSTGDVDSHTNSSSNSSNSSSEGGSRHLHLSGLSSPQTTYCRCKQGSSAFATAEGEATATDATRHFRPDGVSRPPQLKSKPQLQSQSHAPPVFIVETERSSKVVVPGTIADDASSSCSSDEDADNSDGNGRAVKLSLVSPLTSSILLRNPSGHPLSTAFSIPRRTAASAEKETPSKEPEKCTVPASVSSWLQELPDQRPSAANNAQATVKTQSKSTNLPATTQSSPPIPTPTHKKKAK